MMELTDQPRFSSLFGVREQTAWTSFEQIFFDVKGRKRVAEASVVPGFPLTFLNFFFANLKQT